MPNPKDPEKLEQYRQKQCENALARSFGQINKGKKQSPEAVAKRVLSLRKRVGDPEYRKMLSENAKRCGAGKWMKGRKNPSLAKYSAARKGKTYDEIYGPERASEEAKKRSDGNKGVAKTHTPESKERLKSARRRKGKTYEEIYGDSVRAEAEKQKRIEGHKERLKDYEYKPQRPNARPNNSKEAKWRKAIFARDNWTCQRCGIRGGALHAHHIKRWADYPDLRYDLDNGTTYCKECHKQVSLEKGHYSNKPQKD